MPEVIFVAPETFPIEYQRDWHIKWIAMFINVLRIVPLDITHAMASGEELQLPKIRGLRAYQVQSFSMSE